MTRHSLGLSLLGFALLGCAPTAATPGTPSASSPHAPPPSFADPLAPSSPPKDPSPAPPPSTAAAGPPGSAAAAASSSSAGAPEAKPERPSGLAVFEKKCASCHSEGGNPQASKHFKLVAGVAVGHHVGTLGKTLRAVLGITAKATMPKGAPPLPEDERQLLVAWADAQDALAPKAAGEHRH